MILHGKLLQDNGSYYLLTNSGKWFTLSQADTPNGNVASFAGKCITLDGQLLSTTFFENWNILQLPIERHGRTFLISLGTVSHATMRYEDIGPAFLSFLRSIDAPETEKLDRKLNRLLSKKFNDFEQDIEWFINEDLWDVMNNYAPEGYYFGANEGDGSDFGYWPCEEI